MRTDPSLRFSRGYEPSGINLPGRHFQDGVSQSGKERNHLFLSTGDGFRDLSGISGADSIADGRAVALTDIDYDGFTDIVVANANAPMLEIYRNRIGLRDGEPSAGFIALRFVGANQAARPESGRSNRDGYGALVEIALGDVTLVREYRAGEGMAAQNGSTLLVGIGTAPAADRVVVRWPSGVVTRTIDVASGTLLTAFERNREGQPAFDRAPYRELRRSVAAEERRAAIPARPVLESTLARAIAYFGREVETTDPSWISLFGYLHRRFGAVVRLATGEPAHQVRNGVERGEMFEVFRRIDDPKAAIEKRRIAELEHVVDRITASALHCDRIALPPEWPEILENATRAGGYALTHAVLATQWTIENGCLPDAALSSVRREQIERMSSLLADPLRLRDRFGTSTDLWIEALAMMYYAGAGESVDPRWLDRLVGLQLESGAWAKAPGSELSDPHPTALAIWNAARKRTRSAARALDRRRPAKFDGSVAIGARNTIRLHRRTHSDPNKIRELWIVRKGTKNSLLGLP